MELPLPGSFRNSIDEDGDLWLISEEILRAPDTPQSISLRTGKEHEEHLCPAPRISILPVASAHFFAALKYMQMHSVYKSTFCVNE